MSVEIIVWWCVALSMFFFILGLCSTVVSFRYLLRSITKNKLPAAEQRNYVSAMVCVLASGVGLIFIEPYYEYLIQ